MQDCITKSYGHEDDEVELKGSDSDNSDPSFVDADHSYLATAEDNEAAADDISLEMAGITTITSSVKLSQTYGTYCSYFSICLH